MRSHSNCPKFFLPWSPRTWTDSKHETELPQPVFQALEDDLLCFKAGAIRFAASLKATSIPAEDHLADTREVSLLDEADVEEVVQDAVRADVAFETHRAPAEGMEERGG